MKIHRPIAAIAALALALSQMTFASDLSPEKWNPADKKRAETLEMSPFAPHARTVEGQSAIIADTGSPIAVRAGIEALKQGGTAADAAATVALTQIATCLGSYVSYAGVLQLVYFDAKSEKVYSLGASWNSYRGETDPKSIPGADLSMIGAMIGVQGQTAHGAEGRKTLVPGFMAGIEAMHKRFGRLPFAQLFQPAIWYADNGVTITPLVSSYFALQNKFLARTPEGRNFMGQAGGPGLPKAGDRFVQAELAKTLRGVATQGARYMYTGAWGQEFVTAVQRNGGKATIEDMRNYQADWEEPLSTTFGGNTVFVPGKDNEGGHQLLEALNLIEELRLDQKGPYWQDPEAFGELSRIMQFVEIGPYVTPEVAAYQRKNGLSFSPEDRITKAYAKAMAPMLQGMQSQGPASDAPHHSAGVVVVDRWGNVAALVHSINTVPWGSTGIVIGGIPLSDAAGFQQARLAAIKPGDRVPDDMAPSIALDGKTPVLATATVGSSLLPETARIILGILGQHLDLPALLAAPPLLYNFEPPQAGETYTWKKQLIPEGAYGAEFLKSLEASGINVRQESRVQVLTLKGTAVVATIDPKNGMRRSAEDPTIIDFVESN
jgi:gamma-glutamyltranspeptidase / glutathione hydrolase